MNKRGLCVLLIILVSCFNLSLRGNAIAAPVSDQIYQYEANMHYYAWIESPMIWTDANTYAQSYIQNYNGLNLSNWHLATITSEEENQFVFQTILDNGNGYNAPSFLGAIAPNSDKNFEWVTGEPFVYSNFAQGQPDFDRENVIHMGGQFGSQWNNEDGPGSHITIQNAFIIEHSAVAPEPLSTTLFLVGGVIIIGRRCFRKNS